MSAQVSLIALLVITTVLNAQPGDTQSQARLRGKAASRKQITDPIQAITVAFDRVNLVGLGERHCVLEDSQF